MSTSPPPLVQLVGVGVEGGPCNQWNVGDAIDIIITYILTFSAQGVCPPGQCLVEVLQQPCCGRSFQHLSEVQGSLVQDAREGE